MRGLGKGTILNYLWETSLSEMDDDVSLAIGSMFGMQRRVGASTLFFVAVCLFGVAHASPGGCELKVTNV